VYHSLLVLGLIKKEKDLYLEVVLEGRGILEGVERHLKRSVGFMVQG